jgi:hypothetical protein
VRRFPTIGDTFCSIDPENKDIAFLADPQKEIQKDFDVQSAFVDQAEEYFFFIDKNDDSLWSMRLIKTILQKDTGSAIDPSLSPEEQKDAVGTQTP